MVRLVGVTTDSKIPDYLGNCIVDETLGYTIDPTGSILVAEIEDEDNERYFMCLLHVVFNIAGVRCDLLSEFIERAPNMTWAEWENFNEVLGVYREHGQPCSDESALRLARKYADSMPTLLSAIEAKYGPPPEVIQRRPRPRAG